MTRVIEIFSGVNSHVDPSLVWYRPRQSRMPGVLRKRGGDKVKILMLIRHDVKLEMIHLRHHRHM